MMRPASFLGNVNKPCLIVSAKEGSVWYSLQKLNVKNYLFQALLYEITFIHHIAGIINFYNNYF
jgi:hypothetical protein